MQHQDPKKIIKYLVFMGDSLSDRDTFAKRPILYGLIPNNLIVDLSKSPHGRFTNGYTWDDYLCESLVSKFLSRDLEKKLKGDATDIADGVLDQDPKVEQMVQDENTLSDDRKVDSEGERLARTYCEGGLTAYNYSNSFIASITFMFAREIVSTLDKKRAILLNDDKQLAITEKEKHETLVIEWSGANDLITVNKKPTKAEADNAITARMENIKKLYEAGYRNFALFGLPDLACTPRFQALNDSDRENASKVCNYFNKKLRDECLLLQAQYQGLSIEYIDVMGPFKDIYSNPEKYGFDTDKLKYAYSTSEDFKMNPDRTSPAKGYLFWDDIHPTAHAHALLAIIITDKLTKSYNFEAPPPTSQTDAKHMFEKFLDDYIKKFQTDQSSYLGLYTLVAKKGLPKELHGAIESDEDYLPLLAKVLNHGINDNAARTRSILLDLKWINEKNEINVNNPALAAAKTIMERSDNDVKQKM